MFSTDTEFNGLSSVIHRNKILRSHLKILAKIQLSVICTHTVDFSRPGYIWYHWLRAGHTTAGCIVVFI